MAIAFSYLKMSQLVGGNNPFNIEENNPHKRQGVILAMAMAAQKKSCSEVGAAVGVSREQVRLWCRGDRTIDGVMLGKLAEALRQEIKVFYL